MVWSTAVGVGAGLAVCATAQNAPRDAVLPAHIELARSLWPIYHANPQATASSPTRGPGAVSRAQSVPSLPERRLQRPGVSPWTVLSEPYPDGSQAVITTPNNGLAKYLLVGGRLEPVSFLSLDRRSLDFDWGILLLQGHLGVAVEKRRNTLVVFGDAHAGPRSRLVVKFRLPIPERYGTLTSTFSLAPDGRLIALTQANRLIAVDLQQREVVAAFDLPGGFSLHNAFPISPEGRLFLGAQSQMIAVDWDGRAFRLAWTSVYDMRGPGCPQRTEPPRPSTEALAVMRGARCTGSGTTPTIIGGRDGVVVIVDGHAPRNNLVAFWQHAPPPGWQPLPDPTGRQARLDPQVAGVFALPHSTPEGAGFTAENSPAALGNGIIVAQWAGFEPRSDAPRGVQRVDWDPARRAFRLAWANPDVHFNGVPTVACTAPTACHTYGMGWHQDRYTYTSLDFATGAVTGRVDLGRDRAILDQGNGHAVANDGSLVYSGRYRMVNVR